MKKFLVLFVLFALPIVAYLFFASGVHNFGKLPVLNEKISSISTFSSQNGKPVKLEGKITILGFFGGQVEEMHGQVFNLNWVIYNDYHAFHDFQVVILAKDGTRGEVKELLKEMNKTNDMSDWNFIFGSGQEIQKIFKSLGTDLKLNQNLATNRVFIVDKTMALRGRNDDEGEILYGYDLSSVAELKDKMVDDVKVILAEYRLKLKKYNKN